MFTYVFIKHGERRCMCIAPSVSRSWFGWCLCYFLLLRIATTIAVTATPARKHKISLSGIIGDNLAQIHCHASLNQSKRFNMLMLTVPETTNTTPTRKMIAPIMNRFTFLLMISTSNSV
jgi:hypothetical protein